MKLKIRFCATIVVVLWLAGCGRMDRPPMAPVTGRVTLNGAPVEGATVLFHSSDDRQARPGAGLTDKDGRFQVTTYDVGDGGLIGKHLVTVSKKMFPMTPREFELFPGKLTAPETTRLEAVVTKDGDNTFEFDIVSAKE